MKINHTHLLTFWKRQQSPPAQPSHLPRLLLAARHQPRAVRNCRITQSLRSMLRVLDWEQLPRSLGGMQRRGLRTVPLAAYIGAYVAKIDQQLTTFGRLRQFLRDHPALIWSLGFPLVTDSRGRLDSEASLPSQDHFSRKLSRIPNGVLQLLLDGQVARLRQQYGETFGDVVSIDTTHVIAWCRENNRKAYIEEGRYDKQQQPRGDKDCKLGCKRSRNQTPTSEGQPASGRASIGEFYWGYGSGIVATIAADGTEFVLAEMTQTFDHSDPAYFLPLMAQVERRLGRRPRYGAADAAFDAFYTYSYFHSDEHDGFAAVPLRKMNEPRTFDESGLPLCDARLAMPLKGSYVNRNSLVQHRRGRYVCPLLHPEPDGRTCPIQHKKWSKGGCKLVMPIDVGARIRYQLDRESERFKQVYNQRTASERILSQAKALGIERPKLRSKRSIANLTTLTYLLINLRAMQRTANTVG